MNKKILVIDDEESIRELVRDTLETEGFIVSDGENSEDALGKARKLKPDLMILDLGIPTIGGLEVCRLVRQDSNIAHLPIIILTVRSREVDKVIGLEMGADDYVTKPFNRKELIARVKAVLRRTDIRKGDRKTLKAGDIVLDVNSYTVKVGKEHVTLRPKEFDLLHIFLDKQQRVLSREFLCESVLGYEYFGSLRTIDAHVKNLRKALGPSGDMVKTIRGVGYKLVPEEKKK